VAGILQDYKGTVWAAGVVWDTAFAGPGKLCAIRLGATQCYGNDGSLGFGVTALYEDRQGNLWFGAGNGLWHWKPGPPTRYMPPELNQAVNPGLVFPWNGFLEGDDGTLLIGGRQGIKQFVDGKVKDYPLPRGGWPLNNWATLLRDRNGGLWIGTMDSGLLHVHQGKMDAFVQSDGLSGITSKTCSRTASEIFGWQQPMESIVFAIMRSRQFPLSKVSPVLSSSAS
jgi:hypothetical protein